MATEGLTPEQIAAATARRNAAFQRTLNAQRTTTVSGDRPTAPAATPAPATQGYGEGTMSTADSKAAADRRNAALMKALAANQTAKDLSAQPAGQAAPQVDPNRAYDLQRAQISADEAEARKAASTQLQEQAAGAGFGEGSGVMEKMNQKQDIAMRQAEGRRLGGVDVAQAQAAASSAEAEKGRSFVATQADLDRELTKEIEGGRLSLEEKKMAEQTRQFGSQQEFTREMTNQGYEQDAIVRAWQAGEAATDRAYNTSERYGTQAFTQSMAQFSKTAGIQMAQLQNIFSTDAAERARGWQEQDALDKARTDSYYAMGRTATTDGKSAMSDTQIADLQTSDPLAYYAYQSGLSGKSQADYDLGLKNAQEARMALISTLDPTTPGAIGALNDIYKEFIGGSGTGDVFGQMAAGNLNGQTSEGALSEALAKLLKNKSSYWF